MEDRQRRLLVAVGRALADGEDEDAERRRSTATTSISADSRSTTSTMPSGTGQPPTDDRGGALARRRAGAGPPRRRARRSARAMLSARWMRGCRPTSSAPAAPSSGSSTGSGARTQITGAARAGGRSTSSDGMPGYVPVERRLASASDRLSACPAGRSSGREVVGVELVGVGAVPAGDPAVLLVDAHDLLPDQPPRAVDHRQHERGDAEGDHDRGEDQRLRQRVAHLLGLGVRRGSARSPPGRRSTAAAGSSRCPAAGSRAARGSGCGRAAGRRRRRRGRR